MAPSCSRWGLVTLRRYTCCGYRGSGNQICWRNRGLLAKRALLVRRVLLAKPGVLAKLGLLAVQTYESLRLYARMGDHATGRWLKKAQGSVVSLADASCMPIIDGWQGIHALHASLSGLQTA